MHYKEENTFRVTNFSFVLIFFDIFFMKNQISAKKIMTVVGKKLTNGNLLRRNLKSRQTKISNDLKNNDRPRIFEKGESTI
jgi:hypothetical protein